MPKLMNLMLFCNKNITIFADNTIAISNDNHSVKPIE